MMRDPIVLLAAGLYSVLLQPAATLVAVGMLSRRLVGPGAGALAGLACVNGARRALRLAA
jgi:hypothetical protein